MGCQALFIPKKQVHFKDLAVNSKSYPRLPAISFFPREMETAELTIIHV